MDQTKTRYNYHTTTCATAELGHFDSNFISDKKIRGTLKMAMKVPVFLTQIGGYYPYSLTETNAVKVSWVPLVTCVLQLVGHVIMLFLYFYEQQKLADQNISFTTTEIYTSNAFGICNIFFQSVLRISIWRNHAIYSKFHASLTELLCELIIPKIRHVENTPAEETFIGYNNTNSKMYSQWVTVTGNKWRNTGVHLVGLIFASAVIIISPLTSDITDQTFLTERFVLIAALDFSICALLFNSIVILAGVYVDKMSLVCRIIDHESEQSNGSTFRFHFLVECLGKVEDLVHQFNDLSQIYFIFWFTFVLTFIVQQGCILLTWIRYEMYRSSLFVLPTLIGSFGGLVITCNTCAELTVRVSLKI